jgi:hypothetical protein
MTPFEEGVAATAVGTPVLRLKQTMVPLSRWVVTHKIIFSHSKLQLIDYEKQKTSVCDDCGGTRYHIAVGFVG